MSLRPTRTKSVESTCWATPRVTPSSEAEASPATVSRWSAISPFSPSPLSPEGTSLGRHPSDVIQRYEKTISDTFRDYKAWKESKWGEDNLDEVEFEEEDVNLELSIPTIFATPLIQLPSLGELNSSLDDVWQRGVAYTISLMSMIVSGKYYLRRPRELYQAIRAAMALWLPQPPPWISETFMSAVDNGLSMTPPVISVLNSSGWTEDHLMQEADEDDEDEEEDDDGGGDVGALPSGESTTKTALSYVVYSILAATLGSLSLIVVGLAVGIKFLLGAVWGSAAPCEESQPVMAQPNFHKAAFPPYSHKSAYGREATPSTCASSHSRRLSEIVPRRLSENRD